MLTSEDFPVLDVVDLGRGVTALVTGRVPGVEGDPYGSTNLADHVGDDAGRVARNRGRLVTTARSFGARADLVVLRANHGSAVEVVGPPFLESDPTGATAVPDRTDAAVTARPGVPLLAMAADCVPVALADASSGVIGVVHAGWRGCVAGTVRAGLDAMVGLGADPATTRVHLGPAACGDCYEVGPEVVELLELACASPDRSWRNERPDGTVAVDLRRHLHQQLVDAGVGTQAISQSTRCTIEDQHLYSHRRDGADRPTGRHGVVVVRSA